MWYELGIWDGLCPLGVYGLAGGEVREARGTEGLAIESEKPASQDRRPFLWAAGLAPDRHGWTPLHSPCTAQGRPGEGAEEGLCVVTG